MHSHEPRRNPFGRGRKSNSRPQPDRPQRKVPAALAALVQNATNPLVRAVLEDGIDRLKGIIQEGATPAFMHELADFLDGEAAVLTLCDEQGGDRISKLVCGLAYVLGIPYDNDRRVPLLDDVSHETARNFVIRTGNLVDVVEDHAQCMAHVEADQGLASLIRSLANAGA